MVKNIIIQDISEDKQKLLKEVSIIVGESSASKTVFRALERLISLNKKHKELVDKHTGINNKYNNLVNSSRDLTRALDKIREQSSNHALELF